MHGHNWGGPMVEILSVHQIIIENWGEITKPVKAYRSPRLQ